MSPDEETTIRLIEIIESLKDLKGDLPARLAALEERERVRREADEERERARRKSEEIRDQAEREQSIRSRRRWRVSILSVFVVFAFLAVWNAAQQVTVNRLAHQNSRLEAVDRYRMARIAGVERIGDQIIQAVCTSQNATKAQMRVVWRDVLPYVTGPSAPAAQVMKELLVAVRPVPCPGPLPRV